MTANNRIVPNETFADKESPKKLGPYEIPGNGQGHLNKDMQKTIVALTGWHVRSESRSCGGIIAGTTPYDATAPNKSAALHLGVHYLLKQQSTVKFPCDGAGLGPLADPSRNKPRRTEPILADQVKVSSAEVHPAIKGCLTGHRGTLPKIRLVTLGWQSEGFINKSEKQVVGQVCGKLSIEGYGNVHIFNTEATEGLNTVSEELLGSCTGHNFLILEDVWEKQETAKLVHNVVCRYKNFRRTAKPGEVYTAVIFCKTGKHRSVAISILLQQMFAHCLGISVKFVHRSCNLGMWDGLCQNQCSYCIHTDKKAAWMQKEMLKVVDRINGIVCSS